MKISLSWPRKRGRKEERNEERMEERKDTRDFISFLTVVFSCNVMKLRVMMKNIIMKGLGKTDYLLLTLIPQVIATVLIHFNSLFKPYNII